MTSTLMVGFSVQDITPNNMGYPLYGYSGREKHSQGVHDPLEARTMVLKGSDQAWALCVLDLVGINSEYVNKIRKIVSERTDLSAETIIISCIHTHSGPSIADSGNWDADIVEIIAEGITKARENCQPARMGTGAGFLYGYTLNRRWMERPVDPSVNVVAFEDMEGKFLGMAANFGLHPVVMGYDNFEISSDYVGYARAFVEKEIGGTVVFANGAAANVNPITKTVKKQIEERKAFETMTGAVYFGKGESIQFADRAGGKFEECEEIGQALGDRILYTLQGIEMHEAAKSPWSYQAFVNHLRVGEEKIETMAVGIDDFVIIAEPGEIFVETGLDLKTKLRSKGYRFPWVVSYANDWQSYLAPKEAHIEGGYEAAMAIIQKHSEDLQASIWKALKKGIPPAKPMEKIVWMGF